MRRLAAGLLLSFACVTAGATEVGFRSTGVRMVGEEIRLYLVLEDPSHVDEKTLSAEGFDVTFASMCSDDALPRGAFCITGYATDGPEVVFHPLSYRDRDGRARITTEVRFPVTPSPIDHRDIAGSLERLRQSGLTAVVLTAEAPEEVFPGEVLRVEYFAWGQTDRVQIQGDPGVAMEKGIKRNWYDRRRKFAAELEGQAVLKTMIGSLTIIPPETGEIVVPAATFRCEDRNRARPDEKRGSSYVDVPEFRRTAPTVTVAVKPSPAPGHLVGPIRLTTEEPNWLSSKNWMFTVTASGSGGSGIEPPRFVSRPDVPVLVRPLGPALDSGWVYQRWFFEVHSERETRLPEIELKVWDRAEGKLTSVRAKPPLIPKVTAPPPRPEPPPPQATDPGNSSSIETTAIVMLLVALLVFIRIVVG